MGYLNQAFELLFGTKEVCTGEDYTSYEAWYKTLEDYTYEELDQLTKEEGIYWMTPKLQGFRIAIDELAKHFSKNNRSCKYYIIR